MWAKFGREYRGRVRGDRDRFIREDIQVATGCTVAVPLPKSSPLTRPRYSLPNLSHIVVSRPYAIIVIILGRTQ